MAVTRSSRIVAGNTTFLNDVTFNDSVYGPSAYDDATANVNIYVATTGSDSTGDGTSGNPYLTIDKATSTLPTLQKYKRTINLGAGTFDFPGDMSMGFRHTSVEFLGDYSTASSWAISGIGTSSRDNGLILTLTGLSVAVDSLVGTIIEFTSGGLNGKYGVIYHNTADTIYCTSEASNWTNPIITDTLDFLSLNTTINIATGGNSLNIRFGSFQYLNFTGGYFKSSQSSLLFKYCYWGCSKTTLGPLAQARYVSSYLTHNATLILVLEVGTDAILRIGLGTVVDGLGNTRMYLYNRSSVKFEDGETVIANLNSNGIETDGFVDVFDIWSANEKTLRFYDCAAGFVSPNSDSSYTRINLPYLAGNITGNYLAELQGRGNHVAVTSGSVTTALGTNTCSIDGSGESYEYGEYGSRVVGVQVSGSNDAYATTSDATVTDIETLSVAEGDVYKVSAEVTGRKDDGTDRAVYHLEGLFYRNTGGNVTQEGPTATVMTRESDNTWNCTLNADAGNQTIDVRVTGKAATTVDWKAVVKYILLE